MLKTSIEHQLLRLHVFLGDDADQLDELYQAFQEADRDRRGSLKTPAEVELVLSKFLAPKDLHKINIESLVARFGTSSSRFDYTSFCKQLQQPPLLQTEPAQSGRTSPSKRKLKSPTKPRDREHARIRLDKRLESQRLLMESVRHKLIRGIQGDEIDGFEGIQNALHRLDEAGEGYLDAHIFMKKFIQRLKCPLTRPEREFLLEQLRALSTEQEGDVLDYEQLGRICNLNSDDSLFESDTEQEPVKPPSPSKTLQLGSAFLASEKRLSEFLRGPLSVGIASTAAVDTPRCLFTGAEKFLEIAESLDQETTGLLPEQEFPRILAKCGVIIDPDLLNGMLSRFPRSTGNRISYAAFLQRYGQNPQRSRGRRELKLLVQHLLPKLNVPSSDWLRFLLHRFEKYDKKVHGTMKGSLPSEVFLRAVQGRSVVLKLTTDEAAQVTSLFLRSSTNSSPKHLHYHEFLAFVEECLWISQSKNAPPATPSPSKASQVSQPNVPDPVVDTTDMSVGDYLMFHATAQEQRNFESLMEVLQNFQKTMQGGAQSAINPVANGVMMSLGQNLRVKVQFSTDA